MLRIAIQAKGRLNEQSLGLLLEAGIAVGEGKRRRIASKPSTSAKPKPAASVVIKG